MASAADPSLWRDNNVDTPPAQWEAVASDERWWWTSTAPNPIVYIGDRDLPSTLEFDWEIVTPPDVPGVIEFNYFISGAGSGSISLGSSVGSGTISLPTAGYDGGTVSFYVSSQYDDGAYGGSVALLGPDIPAAVSTYNINLSWTAAEAGTYPVTQYRLYRSLDGDPFGLLAQISANDPRTYVDPNIDTAVTYAYRITSVDYHGNESVDSNTVTLEYVEIPPT